MVFIFIVDDERNESSFKIHKSPIKYVDIIKINNNYYCISKDKEGNFKYHFII